MLSTKRNSNFDFQTENASDTKKEKLASRAGDLDPDMYHFSRRKSSFLRTHDGLSEEKRSHIQ